MTTLYGIKNCDTVKKARKWLEANQIAYRFHDLRSDGLARERLEAWSHHLGWETLLNRRGTTWRQLSPEQRDGINEVQALALMLEHPTLIKRPLLELESGEIHCGFSDGQYHEIFSI